MQLFNVLLEWYAYVNGKVHLIYKYYSLVLRCPLKENKCNCWTWGKLPSNFLLSANFLISCQFLFPRGKGDFARTTFFYVNGSVYIVWVICCQIILFSWVFSGLHRRFILVSGNNADWLENLSSDSRVRFAHTSAVIRTCNCFTFFKVLS